MSRLARLVDGVVEAVNPRGALERQRARSALAVSRYLIGGGSYTGARTDRPSLRNWFPAARSPDDDALPDLDTLRGRSRDAVRNHPIAGGIVNTKTTNVVGTGLRPRANPDWRVLGIGRSAAKAWARRAEAIFSLHCNRLHISGELPFPQVQDLAYRAPLESGDLLVVRRYVEETGDLLGTRIQFVEADRICNPHAFSAERDIEAGVELDRYGRHVAYHVAAEYPGYGVASGKTERIEVMGDAGRRAKLLYRQLRPDQRRGIPVLAPVLEPLVQLTRYSNAELTAAVIAAFFTVFVKSEGGDPEDLGLNGYLSADGEAAENRDGAGVLSTDAREIHLGHGTVVDLEEGESIETANPTRPNPEFDPFWVAMVREIAVAVDLPFEILVKHFQSSYSASRAAFLMAWKSFLRDREWLACCFCDLVWAWTIEEAVARGLLDAPGFFDDPIRRHAWLTCEWDGDAPGQIDELKETKAARERIDAGISSEAREAARITGADWDREIEQRAYELDRRRELGLPLPDGAYSTEVDPEEDPDAADLAESVA